MTMCIASNMQVERRSGRLMPPNIVVRQACDRDGRLLGYFTSKHDETPAGLIAAAKRASDEMFLAFCEVSNIESAILATDSAGAVRWTISPNFRVIGEVNRVG
jgi:hypothetical protein